LARHLVAAHGGTIQLASTDQTGTMVTVNLPRRPDSEIDPTGDR
jgi:signal transduction histidine kinase